jgi:hypothetical protein
MDSRNVSSFIRMAKYSLQQQGRSLHAVSKFHVLGKPQVLTLHHSVRRMQSAVLSVATLNAIVMPTF